MEISWFSNTERSTMGLKLVMRKSSYGNTWGIRIGSIGYRGAVDKGWMKRRRPLVTASQLANYVQLE